MPSPLDQFKGNLHLSRIKEIEKIRSGIESTLDNNILKHFTDHSLTHSDRLIKILKDLINDNLLLNDEKKLTQNELFVLLLSVYLHDIGMHVPKAHGIEKPICELDGEDYTKIRTCHGEVSSNILEEMMETRQDSFGTGINVNTPLIKNYLDFVCKIISKHQSVVKYNPNETIDFENGKIRIGVLISLLRIADQLDCDHNRIDEEKLLQYSIPKNSLLHWAACKYIDSVSINDGNIKIIASYPDHFPSTHIEILNKYITNKLKSELDICRDVLWGNKIKIIFDNKVSRQKGEYSQSKWSILPENILDIIQEEITMGKPQYTESLKNKDAEKNDWLTYWGIIGNPFLDEPLAFGSEYLIETKKFKSIISEIENLTKAKQGNIRLLIGERGLGKTTLFHMIAGKCQNICNVYIIDAADVVGNINTPTELHNKLFEKTDRKVFRNNDQVFDKNIFLNKADSGNFKIICIDSLDRLPDEKQGILEDFLIQSQHIFSRLRNKSIIILSCSDEWKRFLDSKELSYLGYKNQWFLGKFKTDEAKLLLAKRVEASGKSFNDIFDDNSITPLHTISSGNPRSILINAENACRLGYQYKTKKIDVKFFEKEFKEDLEDSYEDFLEKQCSLSPKFKEGLLSIYLFFSDIERRNLDRNVGVDILSQIEKNTIPRETISHQYFVPLNFVTNTTMEQNSDKKSINSFIIIDKVKKFFNIIVNNGFLVKDFLAFYSRKPYLPTEDKDDLINKLREHQDSFEDVQYYEQARIDYNDVSKDIVSGQLLFRKSWDVLENIIVAILIKTDKLNPHEYMLMKDEVFYEDRYGIKRYKRGAGKILYDQSHELTNKLKDALKGNDIWIDHLTDIQWIRHERGNILKSRSGTYTKYADEKIIELCKSHLKNGYSDLLAVYDKVKHVID